MADLGLKRLPGSLLVYTYIRKRVFPSIHIYTKGFLTIFKYKSECSWFGTFHTLSQITKEPRFCSFGKKSICGENLSRELTNLRTHKLKNSVYSLSLCRYVMVVPMPAYATKPWGFFDPFHSSLWIAIILEICVVATGILYVYMFLYMI